MANDDENDRHGYTLPTLAQYEALRARLEAVEADFAKIRVRHRERFMLLHKVRRRAEAAEGRLAAIRALAEEKIQFASASASAYDGGSAHAMRDVLGLLEEQP